ncbi:MAG: IPT/TIG domain-containing protein [bacterium]|nr:IPT/TIG domain-containing protein [bacterium]
MKRAWNLSLALLMLAGCPVRPVALEAPAPVTASSALALGGRVDWGRGTYGIQLTNLLDEFARGATVSLIEAETGITRSTSLVDSNGQFLLTFGSGWTAKVDPATPTRSVAYYIEAIKGIKGPNPASNQANAPAMRLRTVVWFDFTSNGWVGLTSATVGPVTVSPSTTAVSIWMNQRMVEGQPLSPSTFIGCLDPASAQPAPADYAAAGGLSSSVYASTYNAVVTAIANDQDPLQVIVLSSAGTAVNSDTAFKITGVSPVEGRIGDTITIQGTGLDPSRMAVRFGSLTATVLAGSSSATSLSVRVPSGARTGLIEVELNGVKAFTPSFRIPTSDGHPILTVNASNRTVLHAVNGSGTVVSIDPSTLTVKTLNPAAGSLLASPVSVLVNPEGSVNGSYRLYVAARGSGKVVQMQQDGTLLSASWLDVPGVSGLAIAPDGDLYVSQGSQNQIRRVRVNWATGTVTNANVATYTGISGPAALAFDSSGKAFVVCPSGGVVQRFTPGASDTGTVAAPSLVEWAYVSGPEGITVDTGGNCFVSAPGSNVIFKVDPVRNMSAFLSIASPGSLGQDEAGNLYVTDRNRYTLRRVSPTGDVKILAYGMSNLSGIAVDTDGKAYVGVGASGAILRLETDGVTTVPLISGMAAPNGITFRNGKLLVAHTDIDRVSEVALDGSARTAVNAGLDLPGGVEASDDGNTFYAGRLNYTDSWWFLPGGRDVWSNVGLSIVTGGTATWSRPHVWGTYDWNGFGQGIQVLSTSPRRVLVTDRSRRFLLQIRQTASSGNAYEVRNVTPLFSGTRGFPNDVYDVVYDGSRYAYVSCADRNLYRIDTQNLPPASPEAITCPGVPTGLGFMSGVLYAVDSTNNTLRRVSTPATATATDAWSLQPSGAGSLRHITTTGGNLYVTDAGRKSIWNIAPSAGTSAEHVTGLNGTPSRVRAYPDGSLLVRCGDGVYYRISATSPPGVSQQLSTIGCTGCSQLEYDVQGDGNIAWLQPRQQVFDTAFGLMNSRELARDPAGPGNHNWLYVAATHGVWGRDLDNPDIELSVTGVGRPSGLAVHPTTHLLYALDTGGRLREVDPVTGSVTNRATLPGGSGWGLDFHVSSGKFFATNPSSNLVFTIRASDWTVSQHVAGLWKPAF